MASLAFVLPLRTGKTEEWRAWISLIQGPRRSEALPMKAERLSGEATHGQHE
jgi:hypothetical protein